MTSITLSTTAAIALAKEATNTYRQRAAGFPKLDEDKIDDLVALLQTRQQMGVKASEEQLQTAQRTLREQNQRIAFVAAAERAADMRDFFMENDSPMDLVAVSFDDWSFLAKAETIRPQ